MTDEAVVKRCDQGNNTFGTHYYKNDYQFDAEYGIVLEWDSRDSSFNIKYKKEDIDKNLECIEKSSGEFGKKYSKFGEQPIYFHIFENEVLEKVAKDLDMIVGNPISDEILDVYLYEIRKYVEFTPMLTKLSDELQWIEMDYPNGNKKEIIIYDDTLQASDKFKYVFKK
eukprot:gene11205-4025_t